MRADELVPGVIFAYARPGTGLGHHDAPRGKPGQVRPWPLWPAGRVAPVKLPPTAAPAAPRKQSGRPGGAETHKRYQRLRVSHGAIRRSRNSKAYRAGVPRSPIHFLHHLRGFGTQLNACTGSAIVVKKLAVIRADRQGNAKLLLPLDPDAIAKMPGRHGFFQQPGQINAKVLHHASGFRLSCGDGACCMGRMRMVPSGRTSTAPTGNPPSRAPFTARRIFASVKC